MIKSSPSKRLCVWFSLAKCHETYYFGVKHARLLTLHAPTKIVARRRTVLQHWSELLIQFYKCFNCARKFSLAPDNQQHQSRPTLPFPIPCRFGLKAKADKSCVISNSLAKRKRG